MDSAPSDGTRTLVQVSYHREPPGAKPPDHTPPPPSNSPWKLIGAAALIYFGVKEYKSCRHSARTIYGYSVEDGIVEYLRRRGADAFATAGSRGPIDVYAEWPRERWGIQAKASRDGVAKLPGPAERERLIAACKAWRARPVIALHDDGRTTYYDARTGDRVIPPRVQKRRA
ncbi:MAG: hypothetical protein JWO36_795 [Myxococcales bacterium]|nr:hypothetical protein [Myxococcales bacterium]